MQTSIHLALYRVVHRRRRRVAFSWPYGISDGLSPSFLPFGNSYYIQKSKIVNIYFPLIPPKTPPFAAHSAICFIILKNSFFFFDILRFFQQAARLRRPHFFLSGIDQFEKIHSAYR